MKRQTKINIKPKILIFVLTLVCIATLILSVVSPSFSKPIKTVMGSVVVPLQEGMNSIGEWVGNKSDALRTVRTLKKENAKLSTKVAELTEENSLSQNRC